MALSVTVDLGSAVPVYEQLRAQVSAHVVGGLLKPGDRLPSVRALAADLGIAVGTVNRAYRELEIDGVVASRRRTGTVVLPGLHSPSAALTKLVDSLIRVGRETLTDAQIVDLVRGALVRTE